QWEEFLQFRGIPPQHWLIVAKRSITGSVSKQWLEAISSKLASYEQFKSEFLGTWWSPAQQGLVKCKLYQSRYEKGGGLTLSAHLLKFATMASYLEPRLTDQEIIEAIRSHYPLKIQELLVSTKLNTVAEFLEVLKRLELMEEREDVSDVPPRSGQYQPPFQANRGRNYRQEGPGPVRQVRQNDQSYQGGWRNSSGRGNFRRDEYPRDRRNFGNRERNPENERENDARGRPPGNTEEN
ncbi:hypothetical protein B7P43_G18443, partial [Cryptotermes secundus]